MCVRECKVCDVSVCVCERVCACVCVKVSRVVFVYSHMKQTYRSFSALHVQCVCA